MDIATQLQKKGIEPTDKRILILSLFLDAHEPLSASMLILLTKGLHIHRATVFRTLILLEKKSLIRRVDFNEGECRYELSSLPHHHHAVCRTCGAVELVTSCIIHDVKNLQKKQTGFSTVDHAITLYGMCKKCTNLI